MKKEDLFNTLRTRILQLDLEPGSPLDETGLCAVYGVSRTPLREVLQRLAGEGYVRIEPNRGASVSSMDIAVMRSFFQTAPMIYASVARVAAENASSRDIADLRDIQRDFRTAKKAQRPQDMAICNHRFHEKIGEAAGNTYLMPGLQRLLIDHTRISQTFYAPRNSSEQERIETACRQHDEMIDAIEARGTARAVELVLDHWSLSRDRMEHYVRPDPLPLDPEIRDAV